MGYPQPTASTQVKTSGNFFRLLSQLISAGDIFESDVSGSVFQVGPQSDIANINITFFDDSVANKTNNIVISNKAPFYGLLNARNDATYMPANRPGRILFSPADVVPDLSANSSPGNFVIPPVMDVIQYFTQRPISPLRVDKRYDFYQLPTAAGVYNISIPFYGRSYMWVNAVDPGGVGATLNFLGQNWTNGGTGNPVVKQLAGGGAIGGGGLQKIVRSQVDGLWDYIVLQYANAGANPILPTVVVVSDVPQ